METELCDTQGAQGAESSMLFVMGILACAQSIEDTSSSRGVAQDSLQRNASGRERKGAIGELSGYGGSWKAVTKSLRVHRGGVAHIDIAYVSAQHAVYITGTNEL